MKLNDQQIVVSGPNPTAGDAPDSGTANPDTTPPAPRRGQVRLARNGRYTITLDRHTHGIWYYTTNTGAHGTTSPSMLDSYYSEVVAVA